MVGIFNNTRIVKKIKKKKDAAKVVKACSSPLIELKLSLIDGASVKTNGEAIKLLVDALGEDTATEWHAEYMNQVDALAKKAVKDLENLIKAEKEKRNEEF